MRSCALVQKAAPVPFGLTRPHIWAQLSSQALVEDEKTQSGGPFISFLSLNQAIISHHWLSLALFLRLELLLVKVFGHSHCGDKWSSFFFFLLCKSQLYSEHQTIYTLRVKRSHMIKVTWLHNHEAKPHVAGKPNSTKPCFPTDTYKQTKIASCNE